MTPSELEDMLKEMKEGGLINNFHCGHYEIEIRKTARTKLLFNKFEELDWLEKLLTGILAEAVEALGWQLTINYHSTAVWTLKNGGSIRFDKKSSVLSNLFEAWKVVRG